MEVIITVESGTQSRIGIEKLFHQIRIPRNDNYSRNDTYTTDFQRTDEAEERKKAAQKEIDRILDKIRKSGYDSLTREEKQTLFDQSNR